MRRFTQIFAAAALLTASVPAFAADDSGGDRILGMLPNNTTVDARSGGVAPQTTREAFKVASLDTFDPVVFPFVGLTTLMGQGSSTASYDARYATVFADSSIGNFMTTAIVPSLMHQDSRFYRRGEGGVFSRMMYAASRSVVTRTRDGRAAFNISEIGGNLAAAGVSNLYYSPADRTVNGTLTRWGTQVMWDTVANELKEFWPDVQRRLQRRPR